MMLPAGGTGGRVFNMRGHGGGQGGSRLTFRLVFNCFPFLLMKSLGENHLKQIFSSFFRNIVIEDPRPTMQQFFMLMEGFEPYFELEQRRDPGDLNGILFQVGWMVVMVDFNDLDADGVQIMMVMVKTMLVAIVNMMRKMMIVVTEL